MEPKGQVIALVVVGAVKIERGRRQRDNRCYNRTADARALPTRRHGNPGHLACTVTVQLDLARPDHAAVCVGHDKAAPVQPQRVEARLADQRGDGRLVGGGGSSEDRRCHAGKLPLLSWLLSWRRHACHNALHYGVGIQPLDLRFRAQDDAMAIDRQQHGFDIVGRHVGAALQRRVAFGGKQCGNRRTRAAAEDQVGAAPRGMGDLCDVCLLYTSRCV